MSNKHQMFSTIKARGIVLIFVPLLFETLCGLTLFWLQGYYESSLVDQKRTSALISSANYIWMESTSLITHSLRTRMNPSKAKPEKRRESIRLIEENFKLIESEIPSDRREMREVAKMKAFFTHILKISDEMVAKAPMSDSGIQEMLVMKGDLHRIRAMQKLLQYLGKEIQRFKQPLEKKAIEAKQSVLTTRSNIRIALALTSVADVILAGVLLFYFLSAIYKGIKVLHTNTERLSQSEVLLPELNTGDELAELDKTFHEMARSVAAARSRELATINNSADTICVLDRQERLNLINPAAERLFHRPKDELLGTEISSYCVAEDKSILVDALATIKQDRKQGEFECRLQNNSNSPLFSSWNASWSEAEQEFFCVVHDTTERKKLEELRRVFVAMVSHDLRTPLTSIQIFLSNLETGVFGSLPSDLKQDVQKAEVSARKLIILINEFLDFEKLAAGKMPIKPRMIYAETAMEDAVELLKERLGDSAPEVEIMESDLEISADPVLIPRALLHLCLKAAEISMGSPITLSVQDIQNGIEILLAIEKIPAGTIPGAEIFEAAATPVFSGLGLPLSKQIIEAHGGTIDVAPQPLFRLTLPLPTP